MATLRPLTVEDVLRVNGSRPVAAALRCVVRRDRAPRRLPAALAATSPFDSLTNALIAARCIWLNEELSEWNAKYREKFGFVFMICASGRTAPEVLAELKRRYANRPIVELEAAAEEELKITELRLAKLFSAETAAPPTSGENHISQPDKAADRMRIIGAHLGALSQHSANKAPEITGSSNRTRPPITTHVLDTALGSPAAGIEVHLEMWKDATSPPSFDNKEFKGWTTLGTSITNNDGRSGQLMDNVDNVAPGFYRISFNTSKYAPSGFFPYLALTLLYLNNVVPCNGKLEYAVGIGAVCLNTSITCYL
uniref:2-oxo-4-hydroxy-4-carboxy-5-ureidoimidazoline decarboxylase n=1 Tax=Aegilops tauschii TaxID=37682 RepID=M8BX22_AEGTA